MVLYSLRSLVKSIIPRKCSIHSYRRKEWIQNTKLYGLCVIRLELSTAWSQQTSFNNVGLGTVASLGEPFWQSPWCWRWVSSLRYFLVSLRQELVQYSFFYTVWQREQELMFAAPVLPLTAVRLLQKLRLPLALEN